MVGPLTLVKMLHCRNISRSSKKCKIVSEDTTIGGTTHHDNVSIETENVEMSGIKEENLTNDQCRVCLREGNLPIFGADATDDLAEALYIIGAIEVSIDDSYPKHICQPCHALLQGAILFRKTAQQSDEVLKNKKEPEPKLEQDNDDISDFDQPLQSYVEDRKVRVPKILTCKRCNLQFNSFDEYSEHRLSAEHENKRYLCAICHNSYAPEYYKRHMELHKLGSTYICDICGKEVKMLGQFNRHRMTHFDSLPFKCSLCPYKGRFSESLKMHMRSHTGEKPYQCTQCPARFISKSNLNKHALRHKGEHDFRCEACGRGFYTKRDLDMHFKVDHTGIKEHVCRYCDKAFGYRKQMMKHELKVHKREKFKSGRMPIYLKLEKMKQANNCRLET